jgi:hypothetical protein
MGRVLFLSDEDETEMREWRPEGGAASDSDQRPSRGQRPPPLPSPSIGLTAVETNAREFGCGEVIRQPLRRRQLRRDQKESTTFACDLPAGGSEKIRRGLAQKERGGARGLERLGQRLRE